MKEEDEIMRKCGNGNPFTVPEGYFDHFRDNVMERLPEKEVQTFRKPGRTMWSKVKPWFYMTAVFAGMLFGIHFMLNLTSSEESGKSPVRAEKEMVTDQDVDVMMDHSMMDDYSLYECLTEAE
ncbi:hypothetical protein [uncultured Bacteroides sp.]|uniref:hypothetical protein n=1 Tax=uncultured Bacteroides sp. TaxID=162156 RepID=UPI002AAB81A3|nr:hypothetical protein [uncultured Bacteroides sp.]